MQLYIRTLIDRDYKTYSMKRIMQQQKILLSWICDPAK